MRHITHKLAALATAGAILIQAGEAFAQNEGGGGAGSKTFVDVTANITESASTLPNLISTVAYVGGVGLGVAGIFKLKNHVDNPAQTAMKDGLIRIGAGGGLLALPFLTNAMMNTIKAGGRESVTVPTFQKIQFNG